MARVGYGLNLLGPGPWNIVQAVQAGPGRSLELARFSSEFGFFLGFLLGFKFIGVNFMMCSVALFTFWVWTLHTLDSGSTATFLAGGCVRWFGTQ